MAPALRAYFFKRARPADVDDLVQDVLLNLHLRRARGVIGDIESYIFRVAANVWRDKLRRDRVRRREDQCELTDERHAVEELSPERHLLARADVNRLVAALEDLPERARDAFVLLRFEEMSYAQVARHMGISVSAVEKLAARAIATLSKRLQGADD